MSTKPLAIGDRVRFTDDWNKYTDLESDMRQDLADRSLSGRKFDAICRAIAEKKVWTVVKVESDPFGRQPQYEIQLEGTKLKLGYMLDADDLIRVEPQPNTKP